MTEIELSAGAIRYADSGGEGPVIVLCHGLLMTASRWTRWWRSWSPAFDVFGPRCRWAPTLGKYAGDTRQGRRQLAKASSRLAGFAKPVLVAWAAQDKAMPRAAGRRRAGSFPHSRFIQTPDSRTLIPIDQPHPLADTIATFISNH